MATLGGNLVNASPIGDLTIYLLALDATLTLCAPGHGSTALTGTQPLGVVCETEADCHPDRSQSNTEADCHPERSRRVTGEHPERSQTGTEGSGRRTVRLRDFYKGYKSIDKSADEIVESISFIPPAEGTFFNFEKVSKRTYLDIASVNTACQLRLNDNGVVALAHLSAGGVGPTPKYLAATSAYLQGKVPDAATLSEALSIANGEVTPISDARGTEAYKRLLLRQLIAAHFHSFSIAPDFVTNLIPQ
ncbi:MAG: hypothetical protein EOO08_02390 [Chitinophagaceae bacterium]|nr:MAG: hypothetical protein EOO08_02390 [Chitinophagaceae bacterium]